MNLFEQIEEYHRNLPMYKKVYFVICRAWDRFLNATYWKLRNWNWTVPVPRGFDSRHGYSDTPELIEGSMFALFVRYYEGEYLTQQCRYTEEDIENYKKNPDEYWMEDISNLKEHMVFQRRIEWTYNWIKNYYDKHDEIYNFDDEAEYDRNMHKAMHIIVRYHGWMWT